MPDEATELGEATELRRKRLTLHSRYRGFLESDLIFRRFAESRGLRITHACFAEPGNPVRG